MLSILDNSEGFNYWDLLFTLTYRLFQSNISLCLEFLPSIRKFLSSTSQRAVHPPPPILQYATISAGEVPWSAVGNNGNRLTYWLIDFFCRGENFQVSTWQGSAISPRNILAGGRRRRIQTLIILFCSYWSLFTIIKGLHTQ